MSDSAKPQIVPFEKPKVWAQDHTMHDILNMALKEIPEKEKAECVIVVCREDGTIEWFNNVGKSRQICLIEHCKLAILLKDRK